MPRRNRRPPAEVHDTGLIRLGERDGWICHWCDCHVDIKDATRDHVIPLAAGGPNCLSNIKLAHEWCNSLKGDFVPCSVQHA